MSSVLLFPYRTPSSGSVSEPRWIVDGSSLDEVDLSTIDYHTSLAIQCDVEVDLASLSRELGIDPDDLEWLLTARADGGGLYLILARESVRGGASSIDGLASVGDLGEAATFQLQLIRATDALATTRPLAAKHRGAVLWSRTTRLVLAGVGSRLSVRSSNFSDDPSFRDALWRVEIDRSDPAMSVSSAVRVELNERYPEVIALLQAQGVSDLAQNLVRKQLKLDVARQLINVAREFHLDESEDVLTGLSADAVGRVSLRFADKLRKHGKLLSLGELWPLMTSDPSKVEVLLQALYLAPSGPIS